ncbi:MAG: DUF1501 domain-containing protein [Planctomycetaceae bacterium]
MGRPHFEGQAKRVIWLFMDGGVSHVDTFDPKPELSRLSGEQPSGDPIPAHRRSAPGGNGSGARGSSHSTVKAGCG